MTEKKRKIDDFFKRLPFKQSADSRCLNEDSEQTNAISESTQKPNDSTGSCSIVRTTSVSDSGGECCHSQSDSTTQMYEKATSGASITEHSSHPTTRPPTSWDKGECRETISELFGSKTVHSCYTCPEKLCDTLSKAETSRLQPKKFIHAWINSKNWWLCYVEGEGMYCIACKKHHMKHPQNRREVFSETAGIRFKQDALTTHGKSSLHSAALESEMLQKGSCFHQDLMKKSETEKSLLEKSFATAYFLMKEFIANRKFIPLLNFIQSVSGDDSLKYFKHRSERSQSEIFLTIGETLKNEVLDKVKGALAFGLLTDEVADISVTENLVTFVQFFCRDTQQVETNFLSCQNVLADYTSADANAISSLLLRELSDTGLDVSKLTGFASDGASVMTGKKGGVAALLRKHSPSMINIHCVCHRLALSCTDSNESISYIKTMETLLCQLWQFFENSPKRMAAYLKTQMELKSIHLDNPATQTVAKRLKKACRTRWLSLDASVSAVRYDFEAILQTLALLEERDATAHGLLRRMRCLKFIGTIYILNEILPILSGLSRHFQKGSLNFSAICPAVNMTKDKLKQLKDEESPIIKLSQDIDSFTNMCGDITLNVNHSKELLNLMNNYVESLIQNIDRRFSDSSLVLAAFSIFDPTTIPLSGEEGFKNHGLNHVDVLASHFFPDDIRGEMLKTQWQGIKYHIQDILKPNMPPEVKAGTATQTPTEWLLLELLRGAGFRHFFPEVVFIAEVAASLPVSNAWPERGASALKNVKTKQRNRLSSPMLEGLLSVSINGPPIEESSPFIKRAVKVWLEKKSRRKLPRKSGVLQRIPEAVTEEMDCVDASMQTEEAQVNPTGLLCTRDEIQAAVKELMLGCDDLDDDDEDDEEEEML